MGDRLVLWSGGGRYIASKDVASAAIVQSSARLEINWGNGDIAIVEGESWTSSTILNFLTIATNLWRTASATDLSLVATIFYPELWAQISWVNAIGAHTVPQGYRFVAHYVTNRAVTYAATAGMTIQILEFGWSTGSSYKEGRLIRHDGTLLYFRYGSVQKLGTHTIITSDTGERSIRQTAIAPAITKILPSGNCAIAITFTDNSSIEIPVSPCPEWVQVKSSNSCPDGTVKECHRGATVCCFSCQNGRLTLTAQFNKVS